MVKINQKAQKAKDQKKANDLGISLNELYQRRKNLFFVPVSNPYTPLDVPDPNEQLQSLKRKEPVSPRRPPPVSSPYTPSRVLFSDESGESPLKELKVVLEEDDATKVQLENDEHLHERTDEETAPDTPLIFDKDAPSDMLDGTYQDWPADIVGVTKHTTNEKKAKNRAGDIVQHVGGIPYEVRFVDRQPKNCTDYWLDLDDASAVSKLYFELPRWDECIAAKRSKRNGQALMKICLAKEMLVLDSQSRKVNSTLLSGAHLTA